MTVASQPAIELRRLSRRFGAKRALRSVDLLVEPGTCLLLIGPNGAGKTTLLKILATLLGASGGEGHVFGFSLADDAESVRQRTGLLPAEGYLYGELTALENLRFAALMAGQSASEAELLAPLRRVELLEAAGRRVRTYSSGMRKRLALARLLLRPAELVLMDEPYASLDAEGIGLVDEVISEMREAGRTLVIASHQIGASLRTADRAALLERGEIREIGPAAEVISAQEGGRTNPGGGAG